MIDDFADRILILRNIAETSKSNAVDFDAELAKHRAFGANSAAAIRRTSYAMDLGQYPPAGHAGRIVETYGHIRSATVTLPAPTGFGGSELTDFQLITLLGHKGDVEATIEIDPRAGRATIRGRNDEFVATIDDLDDPEGGVTAQGVMSASQHWKVHPSGAGVVFDYDNASDEFRETARISIGLGNDSRNNVAVHLTTPTSQDDSGIGNLVVTHQLNVSIDADRRLSQNASWEAPHRRIETD